MKFVIAIFGLLSTLSAQVICRPVDFNGSLDIASLFSAKTASIDNNLPVNSYLVTEYPTRPVRCFERLQGTFGLGNGKFVHSLWVELKPLERWMSDAAFCSAALSKEPLFRFSHETAQQSGREAERKQLSIPAEFCRSADQ
ncbi:MAG: hypothetical protein ACLP72_18245 [Candidatus Sulfotelmatobacter sp.]